MNYTLMPSLEHRTLVKITIALWNRSDIRDLVARFYFQSIIIRERQEEWQVVEDKVIEKILKLPLPESLRKKVLDFIKPIGLEVLKWKVYHNVNPYIGIDLPEELCWTPQGSVDNKKIAETLIKDENLDITRRYRLACIYCLEDDVRELWNSMPQRKKVEFYKGHPSLHNELDLVVLWTYDIKGEVAKLNGLIKSIKGKEISPYQFAFEYAADGGNKAASEYFLQKLTPREREESLVRFAGYVAYRRTGCFSIFTDLPKKYEADVLCFLLSQMDERQQMEVFKRYLTDVLLCFLDWPWQDFFMEAAKHMWAFISEEDYNYLLEVIIDKVKDGYKDYNYKNLFAEFWQQSPISYKRYVINRYPRGSLLSKLFKIEDMENITLIVKNATLAEKEKLIFSNRGKDICADLLFRGNWNLLEFFVSEFISSKEKIVEFREEIKKRSPWSFSEEDLAVVEGRWSKFFQWLDDLIQKDDKKRSMEEGNSGPAKRL